MADISDRIDLTLNRDFSESRLFYFFITPNLISDINDMYEQNYMSLDEYEKVIAYEKIFGKIKHINMKYDIFQKTDFDRRIDYITHCDRCGQEIRIPWQKKSYTGLCKKCSEYMDNYYGNTGKRYFPWNFDDRYVAFGNDNVRRDLFNLR